MREEVLDLHADVYLRVTTPRHRTKRVAFMAVAPEDHHRHLSDLGEAHLWLSFTLIGGSLLGQHAINAEVSAQLDPQRITFDCGQLAVGETAYGEFTLRLPAEPPEHGRVLSIAAYHSLVDAEPGADSGLVAMTELLVDESGIDLVLSQPVYELTIEPTEAEALDGTIGIWQTVEYREVSRNGSCRHWPCLSDSSPTD